MAVPHPIPYQGSKRNLARYILGYFPKQNVRLIEPFAGSAAVSIAAGYYGKADSFILNDLNKPLMDLWGEIINKPLDISNSYEKLWHQQIGHEKEFYVSIRDKFNKSKRPDYFLYLLARCVKGAVRYNSAGEFNQSPDNRRRGVKPKIMRKSIMEVSRLFNGRTDVYSKDYPAIIKKAKTSDIIYMDPPYQGVCGGKDHRYIRGFRYEEFIKNIASMNENQLSFIISYDGRTGDKTHGKTLPKELNLKHIEIKAGRSTQATLLGKKAYTYESLYISPALVIRLDGRL